MPHRSATWLPYACALLMLTGSLTLADNDSQTADDEQAAVAIPAQQVVQLRQMLNDADASPTEDPVTLKTDRPFFIVGQRDLEGPLGLELRGVLRFDLATQPEDPAQLDHVALHIYVSNAIRTIGRENDGQPREGLPPLVNPEQPFDPVIVDHIVPADDETLTVADYDIEALQSNIGTLIEGPIQTRHTYTLDVTDQVRADLEAGRTTSTFRLRHLDGYTVRDGHSHYLILRAVSPKYPQDQWSQLKVRTRRTP